MKRRHLFGLICGMLALLASAATADTMQVHMVKATNKGQAKIDDRLKAFENLLQKSNLAFKRFQLVDVKSVKLPSNSSVIMQGYELSASGSAGDLKLNLAHKGRQVMNSTVKIEPGKPLIVGGFPDAADKDARILLILSVGN